MLDLLLFIMEATGSEGVTPARSSAEPVVAAIELAFGAQRLVTNEEAARACDLSVDMFMRRFQERMGLSFTKFALRHRLNAAAQQLIETVKRVRNVAQDWGFTDESHLNRLFHRHYGCTLGEYREQQHG